MRAPAVPPRASPVGSRRPRPNLIDPCFHQIAGPRVNPFPLPPQQRPQLKPQLAIEFLQHVLHFGASEVGHPAPQDGIKSLDDLLHALPTATL